MEKITADFYIKVNEKYNVVDVIDRTVVYLPESKQEDQRTGIKWYKDVYKPEYRGECYESCDYKQNHQRG